MILITEMRNWLILFSYCSASFINGLVYVSLIPIPEEATKYYNINDWEYNLYSFIGFIVSLISTPASTWIISRSFYLTLHIIWFVTIVGCLIRYLAMRNFWILLLGQAVIFAGNMLMLGSCSTLAEIWFPNQIILATSIAASANFIGMGFGFAYIPYFENISDLMLLEFILSAIFFIFNLIVLKQNSRIVKSISFKDSFHIAIKDKMLIFLTMSLGSGFGVNYSLISIIGLLLLDENYSRYQTGWLGFAYLISGLLGGLIATYIAEIKKSVKYPLLIFLLFSVLISILFSAFVSSQLWGIIISFFYGASLTGALPLCIRACTNYIPQIHESIPTMMIYLFATIFSCIYLYPMVYSKEFTTLNGFWIASLLIFLSFLGPFIYFIRFSGKHCKSSIISPFNSITRYTY